MTTVSDYRRNYVPGGTYFFTVVTLGRRRFLTSEIGRCCLRRALLREKERRPFRILAIVLLPDHLHTVWTLPEGDADYSLRWGKIKENFTRLFSPEVGDLDHPYSSSRLRHREANVWQRRFWEHTIRDDDDLKRCVDYLHWNPVKHRLVERVVDYPWSSFHKFARSGEYRPHWGRVDPCPGMPWTEWD